MYRVKQLWWAISARPLSAESQAEIKAVLHSAEYILFQRFSYNDQQHSLRVLRLLKQQAHTQASLLKAALLHDIGKIRTQLTILDRCLIVLVAKLLPQKADAWGHDLREPLRWRKAFVTKEQHPQWGATLAEAAGSDTQTVALIYWHQAKPATAPSEITHLLNLLQSADDQS